MRYEDFELRFHSPRGEIFPVTAWSYLAGSAEGVFLASSLRPGSSVLGSGAALEPSGQQLFAASFPAAVRSRWDTAWAKVEDDEERGLRLRLVFASHPDVARLAALPWELLHDGQRFLALSRRTPVVRSLEVARGVASQPASRPLQVLACFAQPRGTQRLDLVAERRAIEEALAPVLSDPPQFRQEMTSARLRQELLETRAHVLHFTGHGRLDPTTGEGCLVLEDDAGFPDPLPATELAELLRDFVPRLRLIVLSACNSSKVVCPAGLPPLASAASALVEAGFSAVLAMQRPISDVAAMAFAKVFYQRLAAGDPLEAAVAEGRQAIRDLAGADGEWATPTFFLRSRDGAFLPLETAGLMDETIPEPAELLDSSSPEELTNSGAPPSSRSRTIRWSRGKAMAAGVVVVLALSGLLWSQIGSPIHQPPPPETIPVALGDLGEIFALGSTSPAECRGVRGQLVDVKAKRILDSADLQYEALFYLDNALLASTSIDYRAFNKSDAHWLQGESAKLCLAIPPEAQRADSVTFRRKL